MPKSGGISIGHRLVCAIRLSLVADQCPCIIGEVQPQAMNEGFLTFTFSNNSSEILGQDKFDTFEIHVSHHDGL